MADIKKKSNIDLKKELLGKREDLRAFRFGVAGSKVRNIKAGKNLRKNISRVLTELRAREIEVKEKQV